MELGSGARFEPITPAEARGASGLRLVIDPPGHDVNEARYLPDAPCGPCLLVWARDTISQCDVRSGELLGKVMPHDGNVKDVRYLPETTGGPRFVSWSHADPWANVIRLWNAASCDLVCDPIAHAKPVGGLLCFDLRPGQARVLSWSEDGALRLWDPSTGQAVAEPMAHDAPVYNALYLADAPGGPRIVSWACRGAGRADGDSIRMWDAETGAPVGHPMSHAGLFGVAYFPQAPDGPCLATWSRGAADRCDRAIRLWDATTGRAIGEPMRHERDPEPFAFLSDTSGGARILSVDDGRVIRVWDASGHAVGAPIPDANVRKATYVPEGPGGPCILGWSLDGNVRLWDAVTRQLRVPPMKHESVVFEAMYIADAPGGPRILSWSMDGTARLWNAENGALIGEPMRHNGRVSGAFYVSDAAAGPCIVTSSDEDATARLWDAASARAVREPMRHDGGPWGVQCPRGLSDQSGAPLILTWDSKTVRVWDTAAGSTAAASKRHDHPVQELQYHPGPAGSGRLLTWDLETVRLWDSATGAPIGGPMQYVKAFPNMQPRAQVGYVPHSPAGPRVIVSMGRGAGIFLWDGVTTQRMAASIPHERWMCIPDAGDGPRLLTWSSQDSTVGLWSVASFERVGREMRHDKDGVSAHYVADAPGGPRILSWSSDGTARWWQAMTGEPIGDPMTHDGIAGALFHGRAQRVVTWSGDRTLRYWDGQSGRALGEPVPLKTGNDSRFLRRLEYLPDASDGPRVVTWFEPRKVYTELTRSGWSEIPGAVRIWDAATGEPAGQDNEYVAPATQPMGQTSLTYVPDTSPGPRILAWSGRSIEIWDAATGDRIGKKIQHQGHITDAAYVPDAVGGPRVLSASGGKAVFGREDDNTARLWDAATGEPAGKPMPHDDAVVGCRYLSRVWGGPHILSWSQRTVHVWSALTFQEVVPPTRVDHAIRAVPLLLEGNAGAAARLIVCTDGPQIFVLA